MLVPGQRFGLDILDIVPKKGKIELPDGEIIKNTTSLKVFRTKGVKCSSCGVEGKYFEYKPGRAILLFTDMKNKGKRIYMTKDHIVPRSKGGSGSLNNLTPMCDVCNVMKGSSSKNIVGIRYSLSDVFQNVCENAPRNKTSSSILKEYRMLRKGLSLSSKRKFSDIKLSFEELKHHQEYLSRKFGFTFKLRKIRKVPVFKEENNEVTIY